MHPGIIISALGRDRAGLVERITGLIFELGGNLEDSRMAILGDEFTLMVLATGTKETLERLEDSLPRLAAELELTCQIRPTQISRSSDASRPGELEESWKPFRISAVALDHPGIVHRLSHLLARQGINVASLATKLAFAPTTGTPLFSIEMEAQVPADLSISSLREQLEKLAGADDLELEFHEIS